MSDNTLAVVMENVSGSRFGEAAALLSDWERLFDLGLASFEVGVRQSDRLLIAVARLQGGPELARREAELGFWAQAYGAAVVRLAELSTFACANFLAQVSRCEHYAEGPGPALGEGLAQLAAGLGVGPGWRESRLELRLALSAAGPLRYDEEGRALFVPADLLPAGGTRLRVALTGQTLSSPIRFESAVARVEAQAAGGRPRGYAVDLAPLSRSDLAFVRLNTARASAPRAEQPALALTFDSWSRLIEEYESSLRKRAAFVPRSAVPAGFAGGEVVLVVTLPDRAALRLPASVVFQSDAGVGLELRPSSDDWAQLRAALAKARTTDKPRTPKPLPPPTADEAEALDYGSWSLVSSADPMSSLGNKVQALLAPPPPAPDAAVVRFRNFEVVSRLGRGGMAEVFYARALSGPLKGRPLAIKRVLPEMAGNPEIVDLFATEANLSLRLHHPNIVRTYEVGAHEGSYFLVMELVDGRNVGQLIHRCRRLRIQLPADFAVYLVKTLLDALDYAHNLELLPGEKLGLVHRDVSPSNLFVSRVGDVKLGDFGVASVGGETAYRGLVGKPQYLSPEALEGDLSAARDVWAAAVMLYELLALSRPFEAESPDLVIDAIAKGTYVPLRARRADLPPQVVDIVERALSRAPAHRYGSAAEFSRVLDDCFDPAIGTPLAIAAVVRGLFGDIGRDG